MIVHRVLGFDKRTERLAFAFDIPDARLREMRELLNVSSAQQEPLASFRIAPQAAWKVAWRFQLPMNVDYCDWFFEPVAN